MSGSDSFHNVHMMSSSSGDDGNNFSSGGGVGEYGNNNCIDDDFVVGDPLEWLMENCDDGDESNNHPGIVHLLPESSLADHPPLFPDFHDLSAPSNGIHLQPSAPPPPPAAQPPMHFPSADSASGDCHSQQVQNQNHQAPLPEVSFPDLPILADPKVTVQSLFMDGE